MLTAIGERFPHGGTQSRDGAEVAHFCAPLGRTECSAHMHRFRRCLPALTFPHSKEKMWVFFLTPFRCRGCVCVCGFASSWCRHLHPWIFKDRRKAHGFCSLLQSTAQRPSFNRFFKYFLFFFFLIIKSNVCKFRSKIKEVLVKNNAFHTAELCAMSILKRRYSAGLKTKRVSPS